MSQTRWQSFIEANSGTAIGFLVSWAVTPFVLRMFGYEVGAGQAFGITVVYTAISLIRSYAVRRLFNRWHGRRE